MLSWTARATPHAFFRRLLRRPRRAGRFDVRGSAGAAHINAVVEGYSRAIGWPRGPHKDCLYRPVSDLPFLKEDIQEALEALLSVAIGRARPCGELMWYYLNRKAAGVIHSSLLSLDDFVDVPASLLPTDGLENGVYVHAWRRGMDPAKAVAAHRRNGPD